MFYSTDNCGILVYPLYQVDGHQIIQVGTVENINKSSLVLVQGYLMTMSFWCLLHVTVTQWPCLSDICYMLFDDHAFLMFVTCYLITMTFWCLLHVTWWPCLFWFLLHVIWWPCLADVCYLLLGDHARKSWHFVCFICGMETEEKLASLCPVELFVLGWYCWKLRTFRHIRRKSLAAGRKSFLYSFRFLSKTFFYAMWLFFMILISF